MGLAGAHRGHMAAGNARSDENRQDLSRRSGQVRGTRHLVWT